MANPEQAERNIVPTDKLAEKIANASSALKHVNRRQFLLRTGRMIGGGAFLLSLGAVGVTSKITSENEERKKLDEEYPQTPKEQVEAAKEQVRQFKETSEILAREGKPEEIPQNINPESLKNSYELLDTEAKRKDLEDKIWSPGDITLTGVNGLSIITGPYWLLMGYFAARKEIGKQSNAKQKFVDLVLDTRADWKETPPTEAEVITFSRGLSYLPTVGGKIPFVKSEPFGNSEIVYTYNHGPLEPSLTAEQQVGKVFEMRRRKELGTIYVHQLTVQGRLPDRFKYAALALILNSPYPRNWNQPFFEAPWGKIAPLIHDGGSVNVPINPVWGRVEGRTDFLEQMAVVHEPQLEQIEKLDIKDVGKLPEDTITRARAEQDERNRLLTEAKAYQRLALALHCLTDTAPRSIPKETRAKLGQMWIIFELKMDALLEEHGIHGAAQAQWFREKPVEVDGWFEKRRESDWTPIQLELITLEEAKRANPGVQSRVTQILTEVTNQIDREIGLLPPNSVDPVSA